MQAFSVINFNILDSGVFIIFAKSKNINECCVRKMSNNHSLQTRAQKNETNKDNQNLQKC